MLREFFSVWMPLELPFPPSPSKKQIKMDVQETSSCMRFVCARELLLDRKWSLPRGLSAACNFPRKHSRVLVLFLGFGG